MLIIYDIQSACHSLANMRQSLSRCTILFVSVLLAYILLRFRLYYFYVLVSLKYNRHLKHTTCSSRITIAICYCYYECIRLSLSQIYTFVRCAFILRLHFCDYNYFWSHVNLKLCTLVYFSLCPFPAKCQLDTRVATK